MSIITTGVGRIGKDAVTRNTSGGDQVTGFSLAMDDGWGDKKTTLWFDCSGWGKRYVGAQPYLVKGAQVFVVGEQGEREHEGRVYKTLRLTQLELVGGKGNGQRQASPPAPSRDASYGDAATGGFDIDEIPFNPIPRRQLW